MYKYNTIICLHKLCIATVQEPTNFFSIRIYNDCHLIVINKMLCVFAIMKLCDIYLLSNIIFLLQRTHRIIWDLHIGIHELMDFYNGSLLCSLNVIKQHMKEKTRCSYWHSKRWHSVLWYALLYSLVDKNILFIRHRCVGEKMQNCSTIQCLCLRVAIMTVCNECVVWGVGKKE